MPPRTKSSKGRPNWPSVHSQLEAARAPAGSRLADVIRANQDLEMLHPAELDDGLPFPPWLRIRWRKAHPEQSAPGEPTVYPLLLERILEWMRDNPDAIEPSEVDARKPQSRSQERSQ